jgi:hypothetical protein
MRLFSSKSETFDWSAALEFRRDSRAVTLKQGRNRDHGVLLNHPHPSSKYFKVTWKKEMCYCLLCTTFFFHVFFIVFHGMLTKCFFLVLGEFLLHVLLIVFNLHSLLLFVGRFLFLLMFYWWKEWKIKNTHRFVTCNMFFIIGSRPKTINGQIFILFFIWHSNRQKLLREKSFLERVMYLFYTIILRKISIEDISVRINSF